MRLPKLPTVQVSVRNSFFAWWQPHRDIEEKEDEMLALSMPRAAWRELWRYITDCEDLIENTRVHRK